MEVGFPSYIRPFKSEIEQALKFNVVLRCRMEAFPFLVIKWSKDGNPITNNQFYKISQETSFEYKESTLRISFIKPYYFGIYVCSIINKVDYAEAEIQLKKPVNQECVNF